jgi:hypothetical protein
MNGQPAPRLKRLRAKRRAVLNAAGVTYTIDAAPAREHLRQLIDDGAGWIELRAVTGCSFSTIYHLLHADRAHVTRDVAQRILAVQLPAVLTPSRRLPALGSTRRVRALYACAHSRHAIADAAGVGVCIVSDLARGSLETVTAATAEGISVAYEQLRDSSGTCHRNRHRAAREHWAPPTAWVDDDLDAPAPEPCNDLDPVALERLLAGCPVDLPSREERKAAARVLLDHGLPPITVAALIGVTDRTVFRWKKTDWQEAA